MAEHLTDLEKDMNKLCQMRLKTVQAKQNATMDQKARNDFHNYRGIFRISVIRSILDRLIYEDSYKVIDSNLTDGNVGCRKNRSSRDN